MAKRRVVVTGMGAVTPIGLSVDEFWQSIKAQKTGFSEITKFDTTNYKCKLAAEVKEFDAKNYMDAKEARRMELFSQYAVAAAKEAIEDAGLEMDQEDPYMAGCAIGSGVGSLQAIEREHTRLIEKGPGRVGPLFVPMMISNMAAGNVSIHFGLKGKSINVVTACATGTNTIGEAFRAIQYGEADIMVSGGTEGSICPTAIAGFTSLTALTAERTQRLCHGRGRSGGRVRGIRACKTPWRKDICRGCGLWLFFGCVSYHISGRRWQRRSKSYVKCCSGCRNHSG